MRSASGWFKKTRGSVRVALSCALAALITIPALLWADAPAWWAERGVLKPGATPDDYAAVNQGQVKNIAKQGYEEMKAKLPGGAGSTLDAIWAAPASSTDDYRAINLGQLKNTAKPFYDRLQELDASIHYPWTGVGADDYALANIGQVKNLFSFDPTAIAAVVEPPADPLAPRIILIPAAEYTVDAQGTLNARVTLADGATLAGLWLNSQSVTAQTGDFALSVALVEGLNTFTLKATDNLGHSRSVTAKIARDNTPPALAITSPTGGTTIAASSITISGTVNDTSPIKFVTVNGVTAYVTAGTFVSPAVPLVNGANSLLVTATDILGNTSTTSISITAQVPMETGTAIPLPPVVLTATPIEGNAPFPVIFNTQINTPGTLQKVVYDFEGTHQNLQVATNLSPVAHAYTESGDYYPVATVYTTAGVFTSKGGPSVPVADRLRIKVTGDDSPLVAWTAMKKFILAQDINGAAMYVSYNRQPGFIAMMTDLGTIESMKMVNDFGIPKEDQTYNDVAQYNAAISTPIGLMSFPISFMKEDGQWHVDSF